MTRPITPAWLTIGTTTCCDARWSYCYVSGQREKVDGKWKLLNKGYWDAKCSKCGENKIQYN